MVMRFEFGELEFLKFMVLIEFVNWVEWFMMVSFGREIASDESAPQLFVCAGFLYSAGFRFMIC